MTALRQIWECQGCAMTVRNACGDEIPAPPGWDLDRDRCVTCASQDDPEVKARMLLLKGTRPMKVQEACPTLLPGRAGKLREELIASGDLDPSTVQKPQKPKKEKPPPKPRTPDPKRAASEELLRTTPAMSNKEIADLAGATFRVVGQWRRKLGIATSDEVRRAEAKALMAANPTLHNVAVRERMRYPVSAPVIRKVRLELSADRDSSTVGST